MRKNKATERTGPIALANGDTFNTEQSINCRVLQINHVVGILRLNKILSRTAGDDVVVSGGIFLQAQASNPITPVVPQLNPARNQTRSMNHELGYKQVRGPSNPIYVLQISSNVHIEAMTAK